MSMEKLFESATPRVPPDVPPPASVRVTALRPVPAVTVPVFSPALPLALTQASFVHVWVPPSVTLLTLACPTAVGVINPPSPLTQMPEAPMVGPPEPNVSAE